MTICQYQDCNKQAFYNLPTLKARWCKAHKMLDMINVVNKKCGCGKQPSFNFPGEIIGISCKECKIPGMINIINKKCACGKRPSFNFPGETFGICCKECKAPEMIDVISKRCACGQYPVYNLPEESRGICCKECKTPDMIVVKKRCACGKRPTFNLPDKTVGMCCKQCKTSEMINVAGKKCPCGKQPSFNFPRETIGICCKECKLPDMINVISKRCPGYNGTECPARYNVASGCQYCLSCDPDDSRRDKYKKYENAFFRHIKGKIDVKRREFIVRYDPSETTKKWARLDGIVFGDGIIVCLEVDEDGHETYVCDESRMHMVTAELLQQYPHTDVCWIRVNPTTEHKNPWGVAAKRVRAERFDAVIDAINNVLRNNTTDVVYIGFD